jgi:putative spermidine/putrescine transport system permease protein
MAQRSPLSVPVFAAAFVVYVLLALPMLVMISASFTQTQTIEFPPRGFTIHWYAAIFEDFDLMNGALLSAKIAIGAALGAALLGTLGALFLARTPYHSARAYWARVSHDVLQPGID